LKPATVQKVARKNWAGGSTVVGPVIERSIFKSSVFGEKQSSRKERGEAPSFLGRDRVRSPSRKKSGRTDLTVGYERMERLVHSPCQAGPHESPTSQTRHICSTARGVLDPPSSGKEGKTGREASLMLAQPSGPEIWVERQRKKSSGVFLEKAKELAGRGKDANESCLCCRKEDSTPTTGGRAARSVNNYRGNTLAITP